MGKATASVNLWCSAECEGTTPETFARARCTAALSDLCCSSRRRFVEKIVDRV